MKDIKWDGSTITEPGIYSGISLDDYHGKLDLLDGPSVSKSNIKNIVAPSGSAKKFWTNWAWNKNRIEQKSSDAMNFGKAVHALMLGDEVFDEKFAVRPEEFGDYKTKAAREWRDETSESCVTPILPADMVKIKAMYDDAAKHPIVKAGLLNGRVERSMFWKCKETGIWLKGRPDAAPHIDNGIYGDLKTVAKMEQDFVEKQLSDMGYYLQGGMIKKIAEGLGLPFESFTMLYVSTGDTPDTAYAEIYEDDIKRGVDVINASLKIIRHGLDTGEWAGADICNDGNQPIQMKPWAKNTIDNWLSRQEQDYGQ